MLRSELVVRILVYQHARRGQSISKFVQAAGWLADAHSRCCVVLEPQVPCAPCRTVGFVRLDGLALPTGPAALDVGSYHYRLYRQHASLQSVHNACFSLSSVGHGHSRLCRRCGRLFSCGRSRAGTFPSLAVDQHCGRNPPDRGERGDDVVGCQDHGTALIAGQRIPGRPTDGDRFGVARNPASFLSGKKWKSELKPRL